MNSILRKAFFLIIILALSGYAVIALRGPNGLSALAEKRRHIRELQEHNSSLSADNLRKRERIDLLKTSRPAQDLEIREKLKLLLPGETQFILPDPPKDRPETPKDGPEAPKNRPTVPNEKR